MNDDDEDERGSGLTSAETPRPKTLMSRGPPPVEYWPNAREVPSQTFICGYCGKELASNHGFFGVASTGETAAGIYICHRCKKPTYIHFAGEQAPAPMLGEGVEHLSGPVASLYLEARVCVSRGANTAAAMCCRKLLLAVADALAEDDNLELESFKQAVDWLEEEGHVPVKGKKWVDQIRKVGNDANHEIDRIVSSAEAERLLTFTEGLLRVTFELPHKMEQAAEDGE